MYAQKAGHANMRIEPIKCETVPPKVTRPLALSSKSTKLTGREPQTQQPARQTIFSTDVLGRGGVRLGDLNGVNGGGRTRRS